MSEKPELSIPELCKIPGVAKLLPDEENGMRGSGGAGGRAAQAQHEVHRRLLLDVVIEVHRRLLLDVVVGERARPRRAARRSAGCKSPGLPNSAKLAVCAGFVMYA